MLHTYAHQSLGNPKASLLDLNPGAADPHEPHGLYQHEVQMVRPCAVWTEPGPPDPGAGGGDLPYPWGRTRGRLASGAFLALGAVRRRDPLRREMQLLTEMRHPNITTVMGSVVYQKLPPLLVMECMGRGSLYDLLRNPCFVPEARFAPSVLGDVCSGLMYIHSAGIIHNDVKAALPPPP